MNEFDRAHKLLVNTKWRHSDKGSFTRRGDWEQDNESIENFEWLISFINRHESCLYHSGFRYSTMGSPPKKTILINRQEDLKSFYDKEAKVYDSRYVKEEHKIEDQIISEALSYIYQPDKSVLDIGCGTGSVISWGNIKPQDYLGIDISSGMIDQAREKYPNYRFANIDANEYLGPKRDILIACYGQINYIGLTKFIEVVDKLLRENGTLFAVMYSGLENNDVNTPQKLQKFYKPQEIIKSFEAAGRERVHLQQLSNKSLPMKFLPQWYSLQNDDATEEVFGKYIVVNAKW